MTTFDGFCFTPEQQEEVLLTEKLPELVIKAINRKHREMKAAYDRSEKAQEALNDAVTAVQDALDEYKAKAKEYWQEEDELNKFCTLIGEEVIKLVDHVDTKQKAQRLTQWARNLTSDPVRSHDRRDVRDLDNAEINIDYPDLCCLSRKEIPLTAPKDMQPSPELAALNRQRRFAGLAPLITLH